MDYETAKRVLFQGCKNGDLKIVKEYLKIINDVNLRDNNEFSLLHYSSAKGHFNLVKYLVDNGANVNIGNSCGWQPLDYASQRGCLKTIKYLLLNGATLNVPHLINKIDGILKSIKVKIYLMNVITIILHRKYSEISIFLIGKILKTTYDNAIFQESFTNEELIAIATFGTQNRPKELLETEEQKYQHLYLPLSEEYPHLFGYLTV